MQLGHLRLFLAALGLAMVFFMVSVQLPEVHLRESSLFPFAAPFIQNNPSKNNKAVNGNNAEPPTLPSPSKRAPKEENNSRSAKIAQYAKWCEEERKSDDKCASLRTCGACLKAAHMVIQDKYLKERDSGGPISVKPLVFNVKILSEGWSRMVEDITKHMVLAAYLERPFVLYLHRRDPFHVIRDLVVPNDINWTPPQEIVDKMEGFIAKTESPEHVHIRFSYDEKWNTAKVHASLEKWRNLDKILYSEFSYSLLNIVGDHPGKLEPWQIEHFGKHSWISCGKGIKAIFAYLFKKGALLEEALAPYKNYISLPPKGYGLMHIRSGNKDSMKGRFPSRSVGWDDNKYLKSIGECMGKVNDVSKWLLVTDDARIGVAAQIKFQDQIEITVKKNLTLDDGLHVARLGDDKEKHAKGWVWAIRDFFLIKESVVSLRSYGTFSSNANCLEEKDCDEQMKCGLHMKEGPAYLFEALCRRSLKP